YFAGVVRVVGDEPHDHGLPCVDLNLAASLTREFVAEHLRRPALEAGVDDLPRRVECEDELVRAARSTLVVLPAHTARRIGERRRLGALFFEHAAEPVDAGARAMSRDGPDGHVAG